MCFENSERDVGSRAATHSDAPSLMEKNWKVARLYGNRHCPEERNTDDRVQTSKLWLFSWKLSVISYGFLGVLARSASRLGLACTVHPSFYWNRKIYKCKLRSKSKSFYFNYFLCSYEFILVEVSVCTNKVIVPFRNLHKLRNVGLSYKYSISFSSMC